VTIDDRPGRIRPFGVQGWVRVHPFGDDPVVEEGGNGGWAPIRTVRKGMIHPKSCKEHGKGGIVASFAEVPDRNGAEAVVVITCRTAEALAQADAGRILLGRSGRLEVRNASGVVLGKVTGLLSTGARRCCRQDGDVSA
jgi:16S rRNA processing protein RimM